MTRNNTKPYREQGLAVFLTALMVLSVVALGAFVAGPVAATHVPDDIPMEEGDRLWAGQIGNFTEANTNLTLNEGDEIDLYEGEPDNDDTWLRELTAEDGYVIVDTAGLATGPHYIEDEDGNQVTFEIRVQNLDGTEFAADEVEQNDEVDLVIDSNRATFFSEVSSPDFDQDDLRDIFGADVSNETDEHDDEDYIILENRGAFSAFFSDEVETGTYEFVVSAADTDAEVTLEIEVVEEVVVPDAQFVDDPYQGVVGDDVTISLVTEEPDDMWVNLSGPGYEVSLFLEDVEDEVDITFNTFEAGQQDDANGSFTADGATINHTASTETQFDPNFRLLPDDFDLSVTVEDADDESDFAGLTLLDRSTDAASTLVAPAGTDFDVDELDPWTADREEVALGDALAVQVDVTGISAYLTPGINTTGLDFTVELQNPAAYATADSFNTSDAGVWLEEDHDNDRIFIVIDMDDADQNFEDGQEWEATFSIDGDENPYVAEGETEEVSTEFTVETADVSLDIVESPYQMTPTEDSYAAGESNLAPGTELNVRFRKPGAAGFVVTVDTEVEDDGTWVATHDFSDRAVGEEFTIRVRSSGVTYVDDAAAIFDDVAEADTVTDVDRLEQQIADLEDQLADADATIADLEDQLAAAEAEADEQRERADAAESDLSDAEDTIADLEAQIGELEDEIERLEGELEDDENPAFGPIAALVALLAGGALIARRRMS